MVIYTMFYKKQLSQLGNHDFTAANAARTVARRVRSPNNQFWGEIAAILFLQIRHDGLGAVLDAQLFVNVLEMIVHGPGADLEQLGNFLVQRAPAQMGHHLVLTRSQVRKRVLCGIAHQKIDLLLEILPDPA